MIEYKSFTEWVKKYVASVFPDKIITPITFRRVMVSLVFEHEIHEPGKSTEDFLLKYSWLINTSFKVNILTFFF